ncbi:MAG: hypothetical protein ACRDJ9_12890, partial [Dehalococcoidia bacterium]
MTGANERRREIQPGGRRYFHVASLGTIRPIGVTEPPPPLPPVVTGFIENQTDVPLRIETKHRGEPPFHLAIDFTALTGQRLRVAGVQGCKGATDPDSPHVLVCVVQAETFAISVTSAPADEEPAPDVI